MLISSTTEERRHFLYVDSKYTNFNNNFKDKIKVLLFKGNKSMIHFPSKMISPFLWIILFPYSTKWILQCHDTIFNNKTTWNTNPHLIVYLCHNISYSSGISHSSWSIPSHSISFLQNKSHKRIISWFSCVSSLSLIHIYLVKKTLSPHLPITSSINIKDKNNFKC